MTEPKPGHTLFAFVRHWSRRASRMNPTMAERGPLVLVTEAVDSLARRGIPATVNATGDELGIDQSGASRLMKSAADAGYLTMRVSAADRRRRHAVVTASGDLLLEQAHAWQEEVFARLSEGWTERQRLDFQHAMTDLIERSHTVEAVCGPAPQRT